MRHQVADHAAAHQLLRRMGERPAQHVGEAEDEARARTVTPAIGTAYKARKLDMDILLAFRRASRYHGGTI